MEGLIVRFDLDRMEVVDIEDHGVVPVTTVGFNLRADGFFDGNPALDLPPAEHCHHDR